MHAHTGAQAPSSGAGGALLEMEMGPLRDVIPVTRLPAHSPHFGKSQSCDAAKLGQQHGASSYGAGRATAERQSRASAGSFHQPD
jgi:hypothetical protein